MQRSSSFDGGVWQACHEQPFGNLSAILLRGHSSQVHMAIDGSAGAAPHLDPAPSTAVESILSPELQPGEVRPRAMGRRRPTDHEGVRPGAVPHHSAVDRIPWDSPSRKAENNQFLMISRLDEFRLTQNHQKPNFPAGLRDKSWSRCSEIQPEAKFSEIQINVDFVFTKSTFRKTNVDFVKTKSTFIFLNVDFVNTKSTFRL